MNKKTIITILLALIAMAGQARTYKTIKTPVAMACMNVSNGELKAREVIMRDTATTVHFTIKYEKGTHFRFAKESYLMDEDGNRYPLRSCEGLKLDSWVQSPESGVTDFTMHFEPMPKKVQVFDFIEGDVKGAFMLLGIHDKKYEVAVPTFEELSEANPYTLPADWFKTDTITICGRIEGYDAERFGFTSMVCYYEDVFEEDQSTLVLDINPDGTFEKRFIASYPIENSFSTRDSKVGFDEIPFFACPSETIDITVRQNNHGLYECQYNSGSSKDVERWLKAKLVTGYLSNPLHGKFSEVKVQAEKLWQDMMLLIDRMSHHNHFSPQEVHLSLASAQVFLLYSMMNYQENHGWEIRKMDGDRYTDEMTDSAEWRALKAAKRYESLWRIDFDNPLLLTSHLIPKTINRMYNSRGIVDNIFMCDADLWDERGIRQYYHSLDETLGADHHTLMAQLCNYSLMMMTFKYILQSYDMSIANLAEHPKLSDEQKHAFIDSLSTVEQTYNRFLSHLSHPYVRQKAKQYYDTQMSLVEIGTPLSDVPAADLIRRIAVRYPGRILMIDFWAMWCGNCRIAIERSKNLRPDIAKRDDIKLVYIAEEKTEGGSDTYKKYVAEWLADEETVCVSEDEYRHLMDLFHFSAIPRYVTITPDLRRVNDALSIHGYDSFDYELNRLKEKLKNPNEQ